MRPQQKMSLKVTRASFLLFVAEARLPSCELFPADVFEKKLLAFWLPPSCWKAWLSCSACSLVLSAAADDGYTWRMTRDLRFFWLLRMCLYVDKLLQTRNVWKESR